MIYFLWKRQFEGNHTVDYYVKSTYVPIIVSFEKSNTLHVPA